MTYAPITVLGYNGTEPDSFPLYLDRIRNELDTTMPSASEDQLVAASSRLLVKHCAARSCAGYHNGIIPLIQAYASAAQATRAAIRAADTAYEELSQRTTTAWHAAHHRYLLAVVAVQDAFATQQQALDVIAQHRETHYTGLVEDHYTQLVPEDQRITVVPDTEALTSQQAIFTHTQRTRIQLLSHTLTGTLPAGFEPDTGQPE